MFHHYAKNANLMRKILKNYKNNVTRVEGPLHFYKITSRASIL